MTLTITPSHSMPTVTITPDSFITALEEVVDTHGESRRSVVLSSTDTDELVEVNSTATSRGIVAQALIHLGVSPYALEVLGDFLIEGDRTISPTGPFHLTEGSRELAIYADDLDKLGFTWGDILTYSLQERLHPLRLAFDCD